MAKTQQRYERGKKWAAARLAGECQAVAETPEGGRNDRLNIAAVKIGHFIPGRWIDEAEAVEQLAAAARQAGLAEGEILPTIRSGLEKGKSEPKDPPLDDAADGPGIRPDPAHATGQPHGPGPSTRGATPAAAMPNTLTAEYLLAQTFPDIRWAVPHLLPEGSAIGAGRPKIGKSWLWLHIAVAVAQGGTALGNIPVPQGPALYLALEDSERRLQARLRRMLPDGARAPAHLHLACAWAPPDKALAALDAWLTAHPGTRLVVIDTLARFRDVPQGRSLYQVDYNALAEITDLAKKHRCAILAVWHTRKPGADTPSDPLDEINGTTGLTGAADTVLVLKRDRGETTGSLFVTGRDLAEEPNLALVFDPEYGLWQLTQDAPDNLSPSRRKAIQAIREAGRPLDLDALAKALNLKPDATRKLMSRMAKDRQILRVAEGTYDVPAVPSVTPAAAPVPPTS